MSVLNNENYIWDLHIHTCKCPKGSSEFSNYENVSDYLDAIINIFNNYKDLRMISFTDHNFISKEVYKGFNDRKTGIVALPGIEVDLFVNSGDGTSKNYKHIIFYFDNEEFDFDRHCDEINAFIANKKRTDDELDLVLFINFLLTTIKVKFLISPHAFKQGNRGIEFDWNDENLTKEMIKLYTDQFFCFWESSGESEISRCRQMLEAFDSGDKISIISFSDSNESSKLKSYLDNPTQYFSALPSFEGLRMVGSEPRRISPKKEILKEEDKGNFIGCISNKDNEEIYLSPKLNVIIGGRGSGKSILLESIFVSSGASNEADNDKHIDEKRYDYIRKLGFHVNSMSGQPLSPVFVFSFLEQNYIYNLFSDQSDITKKDCFKTYFSSLEDFNVDQIKNNYISLLPEKYATITNPQASNIVNLKGSIIKIPDNKAQLTLKKKKEISSIGFLKFDDFKNAISMPRIVPHELKEDDEFILLRNKFYLDINNIIKNRNNKAINKNIETTLISSYSSNLLEKSEKKKAKNALLSQIKEKVETYKNPFIKRAVAINRILFLQSLINNESPKEKKIEGVDGNVFIISKQLVIQKPIEYLHSLMMSCLDSRKMSAYGVNDKKDINNLRKMLQLFIVQPNDVLMESSSLDGVLQELESLDGWSIEQVPCIYVKNDHGVFDLSSQSPGTRANYLMEFIVSEEKDIPLLIDQPEDNIDNFTIAGKLTDWIIKMKEKRQLLVVTHDPNIVVNADAENVILCEQIKEGIFKYINNPLEDKHSISAIVNILEGGKDALERRMGKYGK